MPEYLSPGVYVEEISTGPVPIEGVSTSTAGFVGQTERGPTQPSLVTSFIDFQRLYGGFLDTTVSYLPFAIKGFFDNGGKRAFIARVIGAGALTANLDLPPALPLPGAPPLAKLQVQAIGRGVWGGRIWVRVADSSLKQKKTDAKGNPVLDGNKQPIYVPVGFRLTVLYFSDPGPDPKNFVDPTDVKNITNPSKVDPVATEDYDNLSVDPQSSQYVVSVINGSSRLLHIPDPGGVLGSPAVAAPAVFQPLVLPPPPAAPPAGPAAPPAGPAAPPAAAAQPPSDPKITENDYLGEDDKGSIPDRTDQRTGLAGLEVIDEISLLCVPDANDVDNADVTTEMITQCERLKNRFAILQFQHGQGAVTALHPPQDTSYAAIYWPWIRVFNPTNQDYPLIPPGGHIAGIYANTDIERGVHKAPANYEIAGMVTRDLDPTRKPLEFTATAGQQDILNPRGVNVIRDFRSHGRGIRVWGARTMSTDGQWKYINVRRLFIFVEQSIDRGTQWVVFEPNDETTWARVRRSIENFLITVWRSGALMGTKQEEAFFVKCDLTTMTQDDIDNGRLICYIGIAPVKPAEFVIFRISQKTIEAQS